MTEEESQPLQEQEKVPEIPARDVMDTAASVYASDLLKTAKVVGTEEELDRTYFLLRVGEGNEARKLRNPIQATEEELERYKESLKSAKKSND